MGLHDAARAEGDFIADDHTGADFHIIGEDSFGRDNGSGMNLHRRPESRKLKYGERPPSDVPQIT